MLISDKIARTKCVPQCAHRQQQPALTDGFQNSEKLYHCIAGDCMGWRQFHLSFQKGSGTAWRATAIAVMPAGPNSTRPPRYSGGISAICAL
jgi:hypothetical protein